MPDEYKGHVWSFFNITKGNSWHGKDAQTIFWMGKHWFLITVAGFLIAGVVGTVLWWLWSMWVMRGTKSARGLVMGPLANLGGFWRRSVSGGKEGGRYQLVDRMA